jgi:hypothetical protein
MLLRKRDDLSHIGLQYDFVGTWSVHPIRTYQNIWVSAKEFIILGDLGSIG